MHYISLPVSLVVAGLVRILKRRAADSPRPLESRECSPPRPPRGHSTTWRSIWRSLRLDHIRILLLIRKHNAQAPPMDCAHSRHVIHAGPMSSAGDGGLKVLSASRLAWCRYHRLGCLFHFDGNSCTFPQ